MPAYRKISGVWHSGVYWRKVSGVWKLGVLYRKVGGVWKVIAGQLSAAAAPANVGGSGGGGVTQIVVSNSSVVTVTNAVGVPTYVWSYVSGVILTVNSPNAASTSFQKSLAPGSNVSAVYKCTVTDPATGLSADTNNVNVLLNN